MLTVVNVGGSKGTFTIGKTLRRIEEEARGTCESGAWNNEENVRESREELELECHCSALCTLLLPAETQPTLNPSVKDTNHPN